jgi:hypothetical protein
MFGWVACRPRLTWRRFNLAGRRCLNHIPSPHLPATPATALITSLLSPLPRPPLPGSHGCCLPSLPPFGSLPLCHRHRPPASPFHLSHCCFCCRRPTAAPIPPLPPPFLLLHPRPPATSSPPPCCQPHCQPLAGTYITVCFSLLLPPPAVSPSQPALHSTSLSLPHALPRRWYTLCPVRLTACCRGSCLLALARTSSPSTPPTLLPALPYR